jgi:hypothetical protein
MTILNYWCARDRAIVAVDTAGITPYGMPVEAHSKLHYLAGPNMIVSGRGNLLFARMVYDYLHYMNAGFDDGVEALPEILKAVTQHFLQIAQAEGIADQVDVGPQQVLMLGWSKKAGGFKADVRVRTTGASEFSVHHENALITPWETAWPDRPIAVPKTAEEMEATARWQMQHAPKEHAAAAFGGRLVVAELTAEGVSIRTRCTL